MTKKACHDAGSCMDVLPDNPQAMSAPAFPFDKPQHIATDAELSEALRACARRNIPALRRLYDLVAPRLLAELVQMLGDRQVAEAALADCYVQIWRQAGSFNPERCTPQTWLLSIARRHAIDQLRIRPLAPPDEVDAALRFQDSIAEEQPDPQQLRILRLAYRSGRSSAEIARALEWPLKHVQAAIRRGLSVLGEQT